jgi:alanine racemase
MTALASLTRSAQLIVDLDAVAANYRHLKSLSGDAGLSGVVKAQSYGLGAGPVARRLSEEGCKEFFLATPEEGEQLRTALGTAKATIWVLNGYDAAAASIFETQGLSPVLNTLEQVSAYASSGLTPHFALQVDTAMNRLGIGVKDAVTLGGQGLNPALVLSHLACSEQVDHRLNQRQLERFIEAASAFSGPRLSLANTGGIYLGDAFHFDLCRPGIGLYGATAYPGQKHGLVPVATLQAPILQIRELQPGDTVGYGASFTADRVMRAATVAAGYADGLPRALSNTGWGRWNDVGTPVLGKVSMDLTVVDITDAPNAKVGDWISFLGPDLDALSVAAETLPYELLTGIGAGVKRVYR